MTRLKGIKQLPADEQVKIYTDLAARFLSAAEIAKIDGTKLTFREMAKDMNDRASTVIEFSQ